MKKSIACMAFVFALCLVLGSCAGGTPGKSGTAENRGSGLQAPKELTQVDGLNYRLNGDGTCCVSGIGSCEDAEIVIPSTLPDGTRVTGIEDAAFSNCGTLKKVTVSDGVESIGANAFAWCASLTSVIIPDSVTSIGKNAFYGCPNLTINCQAGSRPSGWNRHWDGKCKVVWNYNP